MRSFSFYGGTARIILRLWCSHLLPACQAISLGATTMLWLQHGRRLPMCPAQPDWGKFMHGLLVTWEDREQYLTCSLAGAWLQIWPVVIMLVLVAVANYLFLHIAFIRCRATNRPTELWHAADGGAEDKHIVSEQACLATIALIT